MARFGNPMPEDPLGDDPAEAFLARERDEAPDELDEGSLVEVLHAIFDGAVQTTPDVFPAEWEEEL